VDDQLPDDWWPTSTTIKRLVEAHPQHDFDMKEAVSDFIAYTRRAKVWVDPQNRNRAFANNITKLLARRGPGKVTFGRGAGAAGTSSLRAAFTQRIVP
jgi:hypothetical protein